MSSTFQSPYSATNPHPSAPFASVEAVVAAMLASRKAAGMTDEEARQDVLAAFEAILVVPAP